MQYLIVSSNITGLVGIIWAIVAVASFIAKSNQKKKEQAMQNEMMNNQMYHKQKSPHRQVNSLVSSSHSGMQREEWNRQEIKRQTDRFIEDNQMTEISYLEEEKFRSSKEQFQVEMPRENFTEYVPEEFGEIGAGKDTFYESSQIKGALQDEGDIARAKAYRVGKEYETSASRERKTSGIRKIMRKPDSMKKAMILTEILSKPKSM